MSNRIAVVGMGCVYPGALSPEELWENVVSGRRFFRALPKNRMPVEDYFSEDPNAPRRTYSSQMAVIDGWRFDPLEFNIPPVTFNVSDIAHWLALWAADRAIKDAKLDLPAIDVDKVGVILGNSGAGEFFRSAVMQFRWAYVERSLRRSLTGMGLGDNEIGAIVENTKQHYERPLPRITEDSLAGNMSNTIAGRICYQFNFGGGGYTVDGACSSSLLAVNQACEALTNNDLDIVLAGGVDVSLDPFEVVGFAKTKALAKTDIRPYDDNAEGMLPGEGCGIVVLMREEFAIQHGYQPQAIIRGWGHSTDGRSSGITAPVAEGQMRAISKAYQRAGYSINSVDLFEGHGTGTALGDKVEITALKNVLQQQDDQRLHWLGSIKSNIGHCKAAAGVAGLIKAVMALRHKIIPPSMSCVQPNTAFGRPLSLLRPTTRGTAWDKQTEQPRRAAVSAMGFGGSNAHLTLEEAFDDVPVSADLDIIHSAQSHELLCLSAETMASLKKQLTRLHQLAQQICRAELTDLAAALTQQEQRGNYRLALVSASPWELAKQLQYVLTTLDDSDDIQALDAPEQGIFAGTRKDQPKIAALFPGQATQRLNMGEAFIRRYPFVHEFYERLEDHITDILPEKLRSIILINTYTVDDKQHAELEQRITHTKLAQPSIIASSIATLKILHHLGIKPDVALGHSLGEIAALHSAGVYDDVTAVRIAALRGEIMSLLPDEDTGAMLAVMAPADDLKALMAETGLKVHISNYNSPRQTVLSDSKQAISQFAELLEQRKIPHRRLKVSHAFHSRFVAAARLPFQKLLQALTFAKPNSNVVSSMTAEACDGSRNLGEQLAEQIVEPVQFVQAIKKVAEDKPDMWIEVGPGATLSQFVNDVVDGAECFATNIGNEDGSQLINNIMARAFVIGYPVELGKLFAQRFYRPFDIEHYQPELITNPCERPYEYPAVATSGGMVSSAGYSSLRPEGVDEQAFASYLNGRSDYLKDLIGLDLRHSQSTRSTTAVAQVAEPAGADPVTEAPSQSVLEFVLAWVADRTGYPLETLNPDKRLRDDLNLDSIKVGELAIAISQQFATQFDGDPSALSNASINDFVQQFAITATVPATTSGTTANTLTVRGPRPLEFVIDWIAERTGYPVESIGPQKRLRDDLNLDSIKVGELTIALGQHFNVQIEGDPAALSNTTIQAFVDALKLEPSMPDTTIKNETTTAVHTFRMDYLACPLEQEEAGLSLRNRHGLVIPLAGAANVDALITELQGAGARVSSVTVEELSTLRNAADFMVILTAGEAQGFVDALVGDTQAVATQAMQLLYVLQQAGARLDFAKCKTLVVDLEHDAGTQARAGAAVLKTLRQEYADTLKWITVSDNIAATELAATVRAELETAGSHIGYFYRDQLRYAELAMPPVAAQNAPAPLGADDVVLVTGGAKGITAELVMALAKNSGAALALLGSSADTHPDVIAGLQRFTDAGIRHRYYACDVVDGNAVQQTMQRIRSELGEISGFFHGAGVSGLRPFTQLTEAEFLRCFNVKAIGFRNVMQGLKLDALKLLHVISSIIGKMGMHGQADYAYANAWLDEAVRATAERYPTMHCLTLGFSVWSGTGLGHKLGVVDALARQGVSAISIEQGIDAYLNLLSTRHPSPVHVVIGSLPDSQRSIIMRNRPSIQGRFLETISDWQPDTQITVQATLNHKVDRYIAEHVYQGTPLMPGVVAIEAMTQTVMACRDNPQRPLQIRDIAFYRPLIVPANADTVVQITATKRASQGDAYDVELHANKVRYYSATFVFDAAPIQASAPQIGAALSLSPESYNPYPLFQGKFFRRIDSIHRLQAGDSVISAIRVPRRDELGLFLPEDIHVTAVVRDTFLQTGALALPHGYLPAGVETYYVNHELPEGETVYCECRIKRDSTNNKLADIAIFDQQGRLLEKMESITLRISADALNVQHSPFEPAPIAGVIKLRAKRLTLHDIGLDLLSTQDELEPMELVQESELATLSERVSAARFDTSLTNTLVAKQALARIRALDVKDVELAHDANGQPHFNASPTVQAEVAGLQVSLTDSADLSLGIVGVGAVGIDIEPVQNRDANGWYQLLGNDDYRTAEALTHQTGEAYDWSATRVWTFREALSKAGIDPRQVRFDRLKLIKDWYETEFDYAGERYLLSSSMVDIGDRTPAAVTLVFVNRQPAVPEPIMKPAHSDNAVQQVENCLDEFERQLEMGSSEFADAPQGELVEAHQQYVGRLIEETLDILRSAAPGLDREQTKRLQQRGYDMIRRYGQQSNIFYRVLERPFGYPGDHLLLDRMFRNEVHTTGLGYHLDRNFLAYPGTEAVRQRTYWVVRKLERFLKEQARHSLKILDLGAGPMAIERTLSHRFDGKMSIIALDFDNNSFEFAKAGFDRPIHFHTEQQNLVSPEGIRRIREVAADVDVVCSMGLIEYLQEETVVAILSSIYAGIRPGTQVFTSNYIPDHWSQSPMEWFLNWWLVYRSSAKMAELAVKSGFRHEDVELAMDPTGSITLMKMTKR